MFKKMLLPIILGILLYGFWISPEFKEIAAGVSIFLFGMMFLQQGFKNFTGGALEKVLQKSTDKTWKSVLFGFSSATIMQSSSLVSILTISFLSADLITLVQGIGIIFGSNVGTTTGAWLIAGFGMKINLSVYAMPMIVFGLIFNIQKTKTLKGVGSVLAGLGFLFLGIHYMKEGFESFQSSINLIEYAVEGFLGVLIFTGIGVLATVVMQSSHATIILVIAALATGQVTYENSLALIIGANIGTTITAILGSLTSNINGKRLAISDVLYKVTVGVLFILFLPYISQFITFLAGFIGIGSENYTLKLALFHTIFNVLGIAIVIPFKGTLIKVATKIFPDSSNKDNKMPLYLNESVLAFPDTALISLMKETNHLYNQSTEVILNGFGISHDYIEKNDINNAVIHKLDMKESSEIEEMYTKKIKNLYSNILNFITNAESHNGKKYHSNFYKLKDVNIKIIENIKMIEMLQENLIKYNKSTNIYIQKEYNNMLGEIIMLIKDISALSKITNNKEKIIGISRIRYTIEKNNLKNNKTVDKLIRNKLITSYMGSSLINDLNHKKQIFDNLFQISEIIFDNKILEGKTKKVINIENWFDNIFGLSDKKIVKTLKKLKNQRNSLEHKLKDEENRTEGRKIKDEINILNYILSKYS